MLDFIAEYFSKFISLFSIPESEMDDVEYAQLFSLIKDGDILVSKKNFELSNLIMPGEWKHAGVYIDGHVYEAVTAGVRKVSLQDFFYKKDHIGLCRWGDADPVLIGASIGMLEQMLGEEYNWHFNMTERKQVYCSELAYMFLVVIFKDFKARFQCSVYLGREIVKPTDLWEQLKQVGKW